MAYRICKSFEIENGHMLWKHPDKCRFPHGHSRRVEFVLEAETLDRNDMVCDFKVIKESMEELLAGFDHALCVNTADAKYAELKEAYGDRIIGFEQVDPTTEVMAKTIFEHLRRQLSEYAAREGVRYPLRKGLRILRVRLWETSSSWAEYVEDSAVVE
jgi:6-pyruvoyltetrahydropterin/6-carboxytetrahydropterin synthase